MESFRIARAMQQTMKMPAFSSENLLNCGMVAYDADDPEKKVEIALSQAAVDEEEGGE
jgi:CCR4-NOT transcriptional regulation complex NOT5 subunit